MPHNEVATSKDDIDQYSVQPNDPDADSSESPPFDWSRADVQAKAPAYDLNAARDVHKRAQTGDQSASEEWLNIPLSVRSEVEREARKEQAADLEKASVGRRRGIKAKHKDLVERAAELIKAQEINFRDMGRPAGMPAAELNAAKKLGVPVEMEVMGTQNNHMRMYDALYVGGTISDIHYDTSRRMLVDEEGNVINDEWPSRQLVEAARKFGMKKQTAETLVKSLHVWARDYKFNDISARLSNKLNSVEWDGEARLETFLIDLFGCVDSEENRMFSKYFCRSLYERVMRPGCQAPISLCLFGAMDAGKSYFSKLLCRELMFDPDAAAVPYDPAGDRREFLRNISGISVVANMGEMTNFGKIDLRKWKSFSTETSDTFDQKFGFSGSWPRQWIFILDSNSYVGLWRDNDDTDEHGNSQGERRLFPIFVGEIPGATGEVRWKHDFRVNYDDFSHTFWQVMAECKEIAANSSAADYNALVLKTTRMVKEFSRKEKMADRGTVKDKAFDEFFPTVLRHCAKSFGVVYVEGVKLEGVKILARDVVKKYFDITRKEITTQTASKKMVAMDAKKGYAGRGALKVTAYVFDDAEFLKLGPKAQYENGTYKWDAAFVKKYLGEDEPESNGGGF